MNPVNFFLSGTWLNAVGWIALLTVPPMVVMLYFLKLKRQPLAVPSTYLWSRTVEDLHVNTIWQKLRKSLLLFLQLLLLALAIFACLRPGWQASRLTGDRFVFMIDNSASMSAVDILPSRLVHAKEKVIDYINEMRSGDVAMLISFSDRPDVLQPFTYNRHALREKVKRIRPTNQTSDLEGALRAAAGLAATGRSSNPEDSGDVQVAEAKPATLYIFTDGGLPEVTNFSPRNLNPIYVMIGQAEADNVSIATFTTSQHPEKDNETQAFARFEYHNTDSEAPPISLEAELFLDDNPDPIDYAPRIEVPVDGIAGVQFELRDLKTGILKLDIKRSDNLAIDNIAYAAVNLPRRSKVLLVTPNNEPLTFALNTQEVREIADISLQSPNILASKEHLAQAANATYDLIIYDQCAPTTMPNSNTLFIGRVPPTSQWSAGQTMTGPSIIDVDRLHPLTQLMDLGNVLIAEATEVKGPPGALDLISANAGTLFAVAPREGFEDAVLGMEIFASDETGETSINTDWPRRRSFPVFVMNVVKYLGGSRGVLATPSIKPGATMVIHTDGLTDEIRVENPQGTTTKLQRDSRNAFIYHTTETLGVYQVREGKSDDVTQRFAVNLFDSRESNIAVDAQIEIADEPIEGQAILIPARRELWKWILTIGLGVLLLEWYVYNRRVYL